MDAPNFSALPDVRRTGPGETIDGTRIPDAPRFSERLEAVLSMVPKHSQVRTRNLCMWYLKVFTTYDLTRCTRAQIRKAKNFGKTSLDALERAMAMAGLLLADRHPPAKNAAEVMLAVIVDWDKADEVLRAIGMIRGVLATYRTK